MHVFISYSLVVKSCSVPINKHDVSTLKLRSLKKKYCAWNYPIYKNSKICQLRVFYECIGRDGKYTARMLRSQHTDECIRAYVANALLYFTRYDTISCKF